MSRAFSRYLNRQGKETVRNFGCTDRLFGSHLSCIFFPQPAHSCGPAVFCVSVFTDMVILLQWKKESSSKLKLQTIDYKVVGSARPHVWYIWFSCRFLKTFDSRLVSAFIRFKYCPQRHRMSSSRPSSASAGRLFPFRRDGASPRRAPLGKRSSDRATGRDGKNLFPRAFPLKALVLVLRENVVGQLVDMVSYHRSV